MKSLQAVRVETPTQYNQVIEALKSQGFKAFQIGEVFTRCYITIEDRYMQLQYGSKMLDDKGYQLVSFEKYMEGCHE